MAFNTAFAVFNANGEMISRVDWFRTARFDAIKTGSGSYVMNRNGQIVFTA